MFENRGNYYSNNNSIQIQKYYGCFTILNESTIKADEIA